jgi:hypothetical protein
MTARTLESVSTCLADWSILVIGNSTPPRDPNDSLRAHPLPAHHGDAFGQLARLREAQPDAC